MRIPRRSAEAQTLRGYQRGPGRRDGQAVFSAQEAEEWAQKGEKVILVRRETSPEDVGGMFVAQGILTATGGKTSHAAVVARGWGKCCIVGCESTGHRLLEEDACGPADTSSSEGDWITLDGNEGVVFEGKWIW